MIVVVIGLIRFGFSLLFGVAVSVLFAGIELTRKNNIVIGLSCMILLFVQSASWWFFGIEMTSTLYPFIIHVPIILLMSLYLCDPGWSLPSVCFPATYAVRLRAGWVSLPVLPLKSRLADHIFYIATVFLAYYFLKRYVAGSVRELLDKSIRSQILLGVVPVFYYIFDYTTIMYTDILYKGSKWAVQFLPSTLSVFYFVFIVLYYAETQKQADAQRERDMLTAQLQLAKGEFATLRQLQECTAIYRHDMRHHFTFLQGLASEGLIDEIKEYLRTAQSDMNAITPARYCENETVNLILSSFAAKAKQSGIIFTVNAEAPEPLPFSDTELCSLLSNALENAITATADVPDPADRVVSVMAKVHKDKLLISVENPYTGKVTVKDGVPRSPFEGHGYGTRSIVAIADTHGGQAIFDPENGVFKLKIMLPLGSA